MSGRKIFRANKKDWCFPVYLAPAVFPTAFQADSARRGSHTSSLSSRCPHPSSSSHTVESKMASMMISGLAGARVGPAAVSRKSSVRARAGQYPIRMKSFPARREVELATVASLVAPGGAQSGANLRYASISVRIATRLAPREPASPFPRARLPNHILLIPEPGSRPCFRTQERKITPDPSPRTTTTQAPLRHPPVRRG